ncbi:hypothetical protein FRC12_006404 [Ceratobasidium sp. 428]|nr:hypothetical protein FRC12_006404 [Ceratobasidium sp. 428]
MIRHLRDVHDIERPVPGLHFKPQKGDPKPPKFNLDEEEHNSNGLDESDDLDDSDWR